VPKPPPSVSQQNRAALAAALDAPPALMERFDTYAAMLRRWQKRINLVSSRSLDDLWARHFLDSAQLFRHLPAEAQVLADIGSGGGFPGLVLAIIGAELGGPAVHLIESDARKAAFLREVSRETGAGASVVNGRAEAVSELCADVVTARACAPLTRLLPWVSGLLATDGVALLLKGATWRRELTAAEKEWTMKTAEIPSLTDASGVILKLEGLTRIERNQ